MSVKISELPSLETLADNDILAGVDTSEDTTSKITLEKIKNYATEDVYDKEEVDNTIDALQTQINSLNTIYNAFPTASDEGESVTLDDTAEVTFKKLDLKGNTSQETKTGKNLLPNNTTTYIVNGITFKTQEDGSIIINGTATALAILNIVTGNSNEGGNFILPAGEYKLNGCPSGGGTSNYRLDVDNGGSFIDIGNGTTIRYDEQHTFTNVRIRIASGYTANNLVFKPMIRLSSITDTTFEKYVGGIPSPNPQYPELVNVVSGDNYIDICGKNLFDGIFRQGNRYTTGLTDTTRLFTTQNYQVKSGVSYTLSTTLDTSTYKYAINLATQTYPISNTTEGNASQYYDSGWKTTSSFTFTPSQDGYLGIVVATTNGSDNLSPSSISSYTWQLEKGSTASTYEPYIGNTYPIYLGVENLSTMSSMTTTASGYLNTSTGFFAYVESGKTYTLSLNIASDNTSTGNTEVRCYTATSGGTNQGTIATFNRLNGGGNITKTFTSSYNGYLMFSGSGMLASSEVFTDIKLVEGSTIQYISTTPIELCKIGTYQDYIYKDNGSWYLHKEILKVKLTSSMTWYKSGTTAVDKYYTRLNYDFDSSIVRSGSLCNRYKYANNGTNVGEFDYSQNNTWFALFFCYAAYNTSTINSFKADLDINEVVCYVPLATPTNTLIEDTTLIEQLEALKLANSYESQTNISQENNDKPFILDVEAIKKLS